MEIIVWCRNPSLCRFK